MNENGNSEAKKDLKAHLIDSLLRMTGLRARMRGNENMLEALRDALRLLRQLRSPKPEDDHPQKTL